MRIVSDHPTVSDHRIVSDHDCSELRRQQSEREGNIVITFQPLYDTFFSLTYLHDHKNNKGVDDTYDNGDDDGGNSDVKRKGVVNRYHHAYLFLSEDVIIVLMKTL